MRETIEEILRMYNVDPDEGLILSLETFVKHEIINAKHEVMIQVQDVVNDVIDARERG